MYYEVHFYLPDGSLINIQAFDSLGRCVPRTIPYACTASVYRGNELLREVDLQPGHVVRCVEDIR